MLGQGVLVDGLCPTLAAILSLGFKDHNTFGPNRHMWDFVSHVHKNPTDLASDPETILYRAVKVFCSFDGQKATAKIIT
jgi:hypothetical protein